VEAAESRAALSASWLGDVLGRRVRTVDVEPLDAGGVSGELVRLRLDDGSTLVAKRPARDSVVRERQRALGMYEREARFYRELADRVPVRTPRCFFASDDLLVLEDLAPAVAGTFAAGLTAARVDGVIDAFVRLHGRWQGSEALETSKWLWRVSEQEAQRWQQNLEGRLPRFVDRHRDTLSSRDVAIAELVTANLASLMVDAAALPATLCHGDPGPPNLLFDGDGEPAFVDWQLAAARHGALDLAWLLVLGVPSPVYVERRNLWLGRYRERLGLDLEASAAAHALGVALAVRAPIWMGGAPDSERSAHVDAYAEATIARAFAAFDIDDVSAMIVPSPKATGGRTTPNG
jgi:hypothetical protein